MPEGCAASGGRVRPLCCNAARTMLRHADCAADGCTPAGCCDIAAGSRLCVSVAVTLLTHNSLITTQQGATLHSVDAGQGLSVSSKGQCNVS